MPNPSRLIRKADSSRASVSRYLQVALLRPSISVSFDFLGGLRLIADQYRQDNDPNIFMTTVLQHLIDGGESVAPVYVKNGWLELDTRSDYDTAVSVLAGTMASSVFDPTQVVGYPGG